MIPFKFNKMGASKIYTTLGESSSYTNDINSDGSIWGSPLISEGNDGTYGIFKGNTSITSINGTFNNLLYGGANYDGDKCGSGTYMDKGMFYQCTNLTTARANFPSLISGHSMFFNCYNLEDLSNCYINCDNLNVVVCMFDMWKDDYNSVLKNLPKNFTINDNVTKMDYMCRYCKSLKSLPDNFTIGNSVTSMIETFKGCSTLESLGNNFNIPDSVTTITDLFDECSALRSLPDSFTIGTGLTSMECMFKGCSGLESLGNNFNIGINVTDMSSTFYGCSSLVSLPDNFTIPNNVTDITWAFYDCSSLVSLPDNFTIPSTSVTDCLALFYKCSSIEYLPENFVFPECVTSMYAALKEMTSLKALPDNFTVGSNVTSMRDFVLGNTSLEKLGNNLVLPATLDNGGNTFKNCTALSQASLSKLALNAEQRSSSLSIGFSSVPMTTRQVSLLSSKLWSASAYSTITEVSDWDDETDTFSTETKENVVTGDSRVTDGSSLFLDNENVYFVTGDFSGVTDGTSMFSGCFNLKECDADFSNLSVADNMFNNTVLSSASIDRICDTIPSDASGNIGFVNVTITDEQISSFATKGWTVITELSE